MKRRILSIALTLCMLLSMVPMSALAAETYDLYIGGFQFSSDKLTYTSGGGSATYDPDSKGGNPADGRKVKGATIHWVDAATAVDAQVRLYDNLFSDADPDGGDKNFLDCLNPGSLEVLEGCKLEASLAGAKPSDRFQFLRLGYFCADSKDSKPGALVFNRAVSLKDGFKPGK